MMFNTNPRFVQNREEARKRKDTKRGITVSVAAYNTQARGASHEVVSFLRQATKDWGGIDLLCLSETAHLERIEPADFPELKFNYA